MRTKDFLNKTVIYCKTWCSRPSTGTVTDVEGHNIYIQEIGDWLYVPDIFSVKIVEE